MKMNMRQAIEVSDVSPLRNNLGAVVCPLTPGELPAALKNLATWSEYPPLVPEKGRPEIFQRPRLIFSYNCAENPDLSAPLVEMFNRTPAIRDSFDGIEVRFCNLPAEKDVYIRKPVGPPPPFGNKAGPNWLFYETMKALSGEAKFVFQMETDCAPVTPNWLKAVENACSQNLDAWIIGTQYCGVSPLHWSVARHLNGNALYHVGSKSFWQFMDDFFWPWMHQHIREKNANLAYDCAWEEYLNRPEMEHAGHYDWVQVRKILPRFRAKNFIVNVGGHAEQTGQYVWTRAEILKEFPGVALVHGPFVHAPEHIRGGIGFGHAKTEPGVTTEASRIVYRGPNDRNLACFERGVWLAGRPLDSTCAIHLRVNVACTPKTSGVVMEWHDQNGTLLGKKNISSRPDGTPRRDTFVCAVNGTHAFLRLRLRFYGEGETCDVDVSDALLQIRRDEEVLGKTVRVFD
jgi:hypothetical protein